MSAKTVTNKTLCETVPIKIGANFQNPEERSQMREIAAHPYTRERKDIIELAVILIISVAVSAMFVWWTQDDFYINLQYAKHLAASGEWGFNVGHPPMGRQAKSGLSFSRGSPF